MGTNDELVAIQQALGAAGNLAAAVADLNQAVIDLNAVVAGGINNPAAAHAPITQTNTNAAAQLALAANPARLASFVFNADPAVTIYVGTSNAVTTANGIPCAPGQQVSLDPDGGRYTGAYYVIAAAAGPYVALAIEVTP